MDLRRERRHGDRPDEHIWANAPWRLGRPFAHVRNYRPYKKKHGRKHYAFEHIGKGMYKAAERTSLRAHQSWGSKQQRYDYYRKPKQKHPSCTCPHTAKRHFQAFHFITFLHFILSISSKIIYWFILPKNRQKRGVSKVFVCFLLFDNILTQEKELFKAQYTAISAIITISWIILVILYIPILTDAF